MFKLVHSFTEKHLQNVPGSQIKMMGGIVMIMSGILIIIALTLDWNWLTIAAIMTLGVYILFAGMVGKKPGVITAGGLIMGGGVGFAVDGGNIFAVFDIVNLGYILCSLSTGWLISFIAIRIAISKTYWWVFLLSAITVTTGFSFSFSPLYYFLWGLNISLGTGLGLIVWGIASRYIGLIIPGSLLVTIGWGIYYAWGRSEVYNPLSQTGQMLVLFSFGWFLITLLSRIIVQKFLWWPLIPGAILIIVGFGLSIGGNPSSAFRLIGNSGSIGLIIFGLYLLLMKMGIRK